MRCIFNGACAHKSYLETLWKKHRTKLKKYAITTFATIENYCQALSLQLQPKWLLEKVFKVLSIDWKSGNVHQLQKYRENMRNIFQKDLRKYMRCKKYHNFWHKYLQKKHTVQKRKGWGRCRGWKGEKRAKRASWMKATKGDKGDNGDEGDERNEKYCKYMRKCLRISLWKNMRCKKYLRDLKLSLYMECYSRREERLWIWISLFNYGNLNIVETFRNPENPFSCKIKAFACFFFKKCMPYQLMNA